MTPISILLRTFNSAKTLDRVMALLPLSGVDEYLVVDSGSTDKTLEIATRHGARIIHAKGSFNYSKSLNLGFQAAANPWVLVISSHSFPVVSSLLEIFRTAAAEFPLDVAVGYGPNTLNGRSPYPNEKILYFNQITHVPLRPLCGNGNALYRRSVWEATPFDETIRTAEDKIWLDDILLKGFRIAFVAGARTLNLSHYSLRYMFNKGYSDRLAEGCGPMGLRGLYLSLGSHTKKYLLEGMPFGNWIRYSAHIVGQFIGSYGESNNTPSEKK